MGVWVRAGGEEGCGAGWVLEVFVLGRVPKLPNRSDFYFYLFIYYYQYCYYLAYYVIVIIKIINLDIIDINAT